MTDAWATFGADLHIDPAGATGLRAGLIDALREAARTGRLAPGTRLPSSRTLAADLGIARNTVADAYAELVAEGWLTARQGSGTRVAQRAEPRRAATRVPRSRQPRTSPAYSLLPGSPDLATFPAPRGSRRPGGPSPPHPTTPSATAIRAAASNCAPRSPAIWHGPAACTRTPNASSSAPASSTV